MKIRRRKTRWGTAVRVGGYGIVNTAESWLLAYPEVPSSWALPAGRWALVVAQTLSEIGRM